MGWPNNFFDLLHFRGYDENQFNFFVAFLEKLKPRKAAIDSWREGLSKFEVAMKKPSRDYKISALVNSLHKIYIKTILRTHKKIIRTLFLVPEHQPTVYSTYLVSITLHTGLSRKRRFLAPNAASDWTFKVTFNLAFPLDGLDTSFSGEVPFAFTFNPSR